MQILLIEPDYKSKYPPLGLMKISSYHKSKGDNVVFYKGLSQELKNKLWNRIYISTLFTFHYKKTISTVKYYINSVKKIKDIFLGGVMATLMKDELEKDYGITVVDGLLNKKGKLGYKDDNIDCILPDFSIINYKTNTYLNYKYLIDNCYISYATRGCIRKCPFCAVPIIEGEFLNSISIKSQINNIKKEFGEKRNLILLDNNILASGDHFFKIVKEIKSLGFRKGAQLTYNKNGRNIKVKRYVDFNQGIDARLLIKNKKYIKAISELAIQPLRIAFDDINDKDVYVKSVRLAAKYGIPVLSNYILFNYKDTPEDFYRRLQINIELNEKFHNEGLNSRIWSFPMKYSPIFGEYSINRKYKGENWTRKQLRGLQCILNATHGVVGPRRQFFEKAFGKNYKEFKRILLFPEIYIIYREKHRRNGNLTRLRKRIKSLNFKLKRELFVILNNNNFKDINLLSENKQIKQILNIYRKK